ncbi:MAG: phytanoyl-CoA dioxygenase family protein [Rhizonema sp. PD38]|nr:phytanoyl-CoA dioxygenase family protein [Rhizonema sp. PD38]
MLTKFSIEQTQEIKQYYNQNGYVIVSKLLDEDIIDAFLMQYNHFKSRHFYVFRSQDTNQRELLQTDDQGFIKRSIINPKNLLFAQGFTSTVEKCFTSKAVAETLNVLSGKDKHTIWQTMFFDKSTGTVAHQDHYYLDTEPAGHLLAAWFALEDIHPDSGCFFVVPGSHRREVIENTPGVKLYEDHENFVARTQQLIKDNNYQFQPCPLEKGDVLFWHPFTIHGAFEKNNPLYSRKSLTAHYIPNGYDIRHHKEKFSKTVPSSNPAILLWKRNLVKEYLGFFRGYVIYAVRKVIQLRPSMEMRSEEYTQKSRP